MVIPSSKRDAAAIRAPAKVDAAVWARAIVGLDLPQIVRLRRLAGKAYLCGASPGDAVIEARASIDAKSEMLRIMSSVLFNADASPVDGKPPAHVEDAVDAVRNTINAIDSLPGRGPEDRTSLEDAWNRRRWHGSRTHCSACGLPFAKGATPVAKMGPLFHVECKQKARRQISLTFARLVVAKVMGGSQG